MKTNNFLVEFLESENVKLLQEYFTRKNIARQNESITEEVKNAFLNNGMLEEYNKKQERLNEYYRQLAQALSENNEYIYTQERGL